MAPPNGFRTGPWRRRFIYKPPSWHSQRFQKKPPGKFFGDRYHRKDWSRPPSFGQRSRFRPKFRIPDTFQKDGVQSTLGIEQLQRPAHNLVDAAAKVGRLEACLDYTFYDKMICIQAINATSFVLPLYFEGVIHREAKNNRLALLGDRVLRLALCDLWFGTGNSTGSFHAQLIQFILTSDRQL